MTAPRWYVVVDDTPVCPDRPLTVDDAIELFTELAPEADDGAAVEIHQCTHEDLKWAWS